jgi:LmbE family N-acetylglucosaminyl deacetylase
MSRHVPRRFVSSVVVVTGPRRLLLGLLTASAISASIEAHGHHIRRPQLPPTVFTVPAGTRLLVIAPHPDDEVLGAGGLMQRVNATGGTVRVVYLTNGDGYPEGVEREAHIQSPHADDFRAYGRTREREAQTALAAMPGEYTTSFLNFPDGGLATLMRLYWSERRAAYRSPYTRRDRPPTSKALVPETEYRGEDLTQELAQIIGDFRPTLIVTTRQEDQHADHCSAWFFVADALTAVRRVHRDYTADVLTYIVHWYSWPFEDADAGPQLNVPPHLRGGASGWMTLPLTAPEARAKRTALRRYQTQMHVMRWFLDGFARNNELFSRPASTSVFLPDRRELCEQQP